LKIVEQQLLHSLRETPFETDYSVSAAVLVLLRLTTAAQQREWLARERAPRDGRDWHCIEGRWIYTEQPASEEPPRDRHPLFRFPPLSKPAPRTQARAKS
jgi:hypothetical protein